MYILKNIGINCEDIINYLALKAGRLISFCEISVPALHLTIIDFSSQKYSSIFCGSKDSAGITRGRITQ